MTTKDSTLLIVEDEPALRQSLVAFLEDSGYRILQAENGSDGLAVFEQKHPDLVICDLRMPGIDGLELLKRISNASACTPVILLSGVGDMKDVVDAMRLGAADYLIKPVVDLRVLECAIDRAIDRSCLLQENIQYRQKLEQRNKELQEHVDRLKLDLQAGRAVQQQLLPSEPLLIADYRISFDMEPSSYLSGDLVDYFKLSDDVFVFYIADVSGHGASSALITLLIQNQISLLLSHYNSGACAAVLNPSELLSQINQELLKTDTSKHATLFYAVFDIAKHSLTYASAACFPGPIICTEQKCEMLEPEGLAVGLFEDATYSNQTLDMTGVQSIVLLSDGMFELMDEPSLAEKEARLLEIAGQPDHTMHHYLSELRNNGKTKHAPDDITVLTVEKYRN